MLTTVLGERSHITNVEKHSQRSFKLQDTDLFIHLYILIMLFRHFLYCSILRIIFIQYDKHSGLSYVPSFHQDGNHLPCFCELLDPTVDSNNGNLGIDTPLPSLRSLASHSSSSRKRSIARPSNEPSEGMPGDFVSLNGFRLPSLPSSYSPSRSLRCSARET